VNSRAYRSWSLLQFLLVGRNGGKGQKRGTYSRNCPGMTISLDSSAGQKCLDIIMGCSFDCNKAHISFQLSTKSGTTNSFLRLDMPVDSLRICHILQYDLAHLRRSFSTSDLQNFDVTSLIQRHERQFIIQQQKDEGDCLLPSQPFQSSHL